MSSQSALHHQRLAIIIVFGMLLLTAAQGCVEQATDHETRTLELVFGQIREVDTVRSQLYRAFVQDTRDPFARSGRVVPALMEMAVGAFMVRKWMPGTDNFYARQCTIRQGVGSAFLTSSTRLFTALHNC